MVHVANLSLQYTLNCLERALHICYSWVSWEKTSGNKHVQMHKKKDGESVLREINNLHSLLRKESQGWEHHRSAIKIIRGKEESLCKVNVRNSIPFT